MPFTPEAALAAIPYDRLDINLSDAEHIVATWQHFGDKRKTIDPVVEFFRSRRSFYEKDPKWDVHIVIEHRDRDVTLDSGRIVRTYGFSYAPYSMTYAEISPAQVRERFHELLKVIVAEMTTMFDEWHDADDGMLLFLKDQNKLAIDNFLIGMGYKPAQKKPKKKKTKAEKRASAAAYRKEHPDCVKKKDRTPKSRPDSSPDDPELEIDAILGHA